MKLLKPLASWLGIALLLLVPASACAQSETPRAPLATFDYDAEAPLDIREVKREDRGSYTVVDFTYASPAGGRVPALLYEPTGEGLFAGLILMHGMPGSRKTSAFLAKSYVEAGAVVLAITAPFARPDDVPRRPTITFTEKDRTEQIQLIQDLRRGVDLLAAHPRVDAERIGYNGGSYGAAMGGLLAGVEKRIKAYVLWVGDGGLAAHVAGPDDANGGYQRLSPEQRAAWLHAMEPIEPVRFVGMAAPSALFFQAGRNDQIIPVEDAERFIGAGSEPKRVAWYDAGHGLNPTAFHDQALWLEERIGIDAAKGWK